MEINGFHCWCIVADFVLAGHRLVCDHRYYSKTIKSTPHITQVNINRASAQASRLPLVVHLQ